MPRKARPISERFWPRVKKTSGCWLWTGAKLPAGYGTIGSGGRRGASVYTHRLSWEIANGRTVPAGLFVLHHCDNPQCVRPDHLFIGTAADNAQDAIAKGRSAPPEITARVGTSNGRAKLTEDDVLAIRSAYASLPRRRRVKRGSLAVLADRYGVTPNLVSMIARRVIWRHLES